MTIFATSSLPIPPILTRQGSKPEPRFLVEHISVKNGDYHMEYCDKLDLEFTTGSIGIEQEIPMSIVPITEPDEIDRELDAMTTEEFLKEFLALAGAWADMENLSEDGFTDMEWGFTDFFESDESDEKPISP